MAVKDDPASSRVQLPLYDAESTWVAPTELPEPRALGPIICVDTETCDPHLMSLGAGAPRRDGYVVGFSVGWWDEKDQLQARYMPLAHAGGGNLESPDRAINWLRDVLRMQARTTIMANAPYDMGWLETLGIGIHGTSCDIQTVAALIDEKRDRYSLESLSADYLTQIKDERALRAAAAAWGVDPKSGLWKLPASHVGAYAEQDAKLPLQLYRNLMPEINRQDLLKVLALENKVLSIAHVMHMRGIPVSSQDAEQLGARFDIRIRELHSEIYQATQIQVQVNSAASVAKALAAIGLDGWGQTPTGMDSFTAEWFAANAPRHRVIAAIYELRQLEKLRGTFVTGLLAHVHKDRVYPTFNPMRADRDDGRGLKGCVTGRFSCTDPNLQQIPARTKVGREIRSLFLPEPGETWNSNDFASQEPRLLVHYASLLNLMGAAEARDAYLRNKAADYHQMVADMAKIERPVAKTMNLSLMYGSGIERLARLLNTDLATTEALYAKYHEGVPFVKGLSRACTRRVEKLGYIRTLYGRRCRFDRFCPRDGWQKPVPWEQALFNWPDTVLERAGTHKAANALIQGGSADQTKAAMVAIHQLTGLVPLLQIHDELCYSLADPGTAPMIVEAMEHAVKLEVPSLAVPKLGPNWRDAVQIS
jgi:DNA polymerase I-like protein with 3'-5' exonuclease and polymerase domains